MIISASRRTDIPALYMEWLAERIRVGYVYTQNPMNRHQIRRIGLDPEEVQFVFWTKNAAPMLRYVDLLAPYPYYVQFTVTTAAAEVEPFLPPLRTRLDAFRALSDRLGPDRVIWRCDPFVWKHDESTDQLAERFAHLAEQLQQYTRQCTVSFVDTYRCMRRRFQAAGLRTGSGPEILALAGAVRDIGAASGIRVAACCEPAVAHVLPSARCIDAALLGRLSGRTLSGRRDPSQRPGCGCSISTDIGAYNTCTHGCLYCYACRSMRRIPADTTGPMLQRGQEHSTEGDE